MKYRFSIYAVLEGLEQRLGRLENALVESSHWAWTAEEGSGALALRKACQALTTLDYEDEADNVDQGIAAVVSVPNDVLALVGGVNQAKRMLKQSFLEITNERVLIEGERKPLALAILRDMGRARLNRLRAYRQLFTLDSTPSHIGFSRSHIRTVARKSNMQVLAWLSKMAQENTESYRHIIAEMNPDEPLALVKGRYSSQRANVCIDGDWSMMPAHLPLFIPTSSLSDMAIRPVPDKQTDDDRAVRERSDERLMSAPLFTIGATSIYRYDAAYLDSVGES